MALRPTPDTGGADGKWRPGPMSRGSNRKTLQRSCTSVINDKPQKPKLALCCRLFRPVCKRRTSFTSDFIASHGYFCKRHFINFVSPLQLNLLLSSTILNNKLDEIIRWYYPRAGSQGRVGAGVCQDSQSSPNHINRAAAFK